jgi:hypothetical protein
VPDDELRRNMRPRRGGASSLGVPASEGLIRRYPYPVSGTVSAIQGAKPYPANYVPPWMKRRALLFDAQRAAERAMHVGESVDKPPAEREGVIHLGVEKVIHLLAIVIALLLTAMGKARHLLP